MVCNKHMEIIWVIQDLETGFLKWQNFVDTDLEL